MKDGPLPPLDGSRHFRRGVYMLLIAASMATMFGRILSVESQRGATPMLSANDRSRWLTIRALGDHGTYALDDVLQRRTDWWTIDMVRHLGPDGREHFYSSKPPLLPTLLAGQYWLIRSVTGVTLADDPFYVIRLMLIATNLLPMLLYFLVFVWLVESLGTSDWGRIFVITCATWGTFLTTFAVTLNNHSPAAISGLLAVAVMLGIWRGAVSSFGWYALAGSCAAFAAANELPALSLFALLAVAAWWTDWRKTLLGFVPPALIVGAAFAGTTVIAHNSWKPPYAHRSDGPVIATLSASLADVLTAGPPNAQLLRELSQAGLPVKETATLRETLTPQRWELQTEAGIRYALVATPTGVELRSWDNWYEYAGSYWSSGEKKGVDVGEESRAVYAFHLLLGHHGIFSLTPIWLFSVLGLAYWLRSNDRSLQAIAILTLLISVVCIAFYLSRPTEDRNYGGVCCGARWRFWLIPLWLLCLLPAADRLAAHRAGRGIAILFLLISVLSATYAGQNPWSQPWLFDYWTHLGWIAY